MKASHGSHHRTRHSTARVHMAWIEVRDSLWFIPGVITALCALLAVGITQAELLGWIEISHRSWLFGSGAEGARGVLTSIGGGLITVTGVVFSVTIVALQLASSQFSPRVLRNFMADRANQVVLGVFIGTFTYTLIVLRTVTNPADEYSAFIPRAGVAGALVLVLISIGCLIFFINHAAESIQVSSILQRVAGRTVHSIENLFPEMDVGPRELDEHADSGGDPRGDGNRLHEAEPDHEPAFRLIARKSGYLQAIDESGATELAKKHTLRVRMVPHIGTWVYRGSEIARVTPAHTVDEGLADDLADCFVIGHERTPEQDVEFGIIELADVAVKALSPGINDPVTAMFAIDRLGEVLLELGLRRTPPPVTAPGGAVFAPRYTSFERSLGLAFDQVRLFATNNPGVVKRVLHVLGELGRLLPASRTPALHGMAETILHEVRHCLRPGSDLQEIEALASEIGMNGESATPALRRAEPA